MGSRGCYAWFLFALGVSVRSSLLTFDWSGWDSFNAFALWRRMSRFVISYVWFLTYVGGCLTGWCVHCTSIAVVFGMPLSSIFSVCRYTLIMRNVPPDLGISFWYVSISVVINLFELTGSGRLSTNSFSFGFKTGVLCTHLSYYYLYRFLGLLSVFRLCFLS